MGRALISVLMCSAVAGCVSGDSGVNPPPAREAAAPPDVRVTPAARALKPLVRAPRASGPTVFDPVVVPDRDRFRRAQPRAQRDAERIARIGAQRVITHRLLDQLAVARAHSPHLTPGEVVIRQGKRAYRNPWVEGPLAGLDQRTVWTDGATAMWRLRAALVLPAPGEVVWPLELPAGAELRFGWALGGRVPNAGPATLTVHINRVGETPVLLWEQTIEARPIHRLKAWTDEALDLSAYAGQSVELRLGVTSPTAGKGHRQTAFFAEPNIVVNTDSAATRAAARARTGLDVADNIIVIIVDAQRADTVGVTRNRLPSFLPVMEAMAAEGAQLSRAYSVGNQTRLSTFALLSSQYPTYGHYHHVRWNFSEEQKATFYDADPPLLPRVLRELGYRTAGIANNLFLFGNLDLSLDGGFDHFIDHRHQTKDTAWITESTVDWLKAHHDERFFLMVNYNGPHSPYQPPDASRAQVEAAGDLTGYDARYLGEVKWSDENIGVLMATLRDLKLDSKTMVVVTSDHGEVMDVKHQCFNRNWKSNCLHHHGKTLFEEELHVPLLIRQTGRIAAGTVVSQPFSHLDLGPTLLGLLGVRPAKGQLGRDLSGALLNQGGPSEPAPILAEARLSTAVVWDDFKYILHDERERMTFEHPTLFDRKRGLEELYDLKADPGELTNLAWGAEPKRLELMRQKLTGLRAELATRRGEKAPEPPPLVVTAPVADEPADDTLAAPVALDLTKDPVVETSARLSTVLFHGGAEGARFEGRIRTDDAFVGFEAIGDLADGVTQVDAQTIVVDAMADITRRGVRFRTRTPRATVRFELSIDGQPLRADRFYVGAYGLGLYSDPLVATGARDYQLATAKARGPSRTSAVKAGAFFYCHKAGPADSGGSGDVESDEEIDVEVRNLMKDWGYTSK